MFMEEKPSYPSPSKKETEKFLGFVNSYLPKIKYIDNYSREEISFLDVAVKRNDNHLVTDLHIKPKETHQYLQASSYHGYYTKRSILYIQVLRLNKIYSDNSFG